MHTMGFIDTFGKPLADSLKMEFRTDSATEILTSVVYDAQDNTIFASGYFQQSSSTLCSIIAVDNLDHIVNWQRSAQLSGSSEFQCTSAVVTSTSLAVIGHTNSYELALIYLDKSTGAYSSGSKFSMQSFYSSIASVLIGGRLIILTGKTNELKVYSGLESDMTSLKMAKVTSASKPAS